MIKRDGINYIHYCEDEKQDFICYQRANRVGLNLYKEIEPNGLSYPYTKLLLKIKVCPICGYSPNSKVLISASIEAKMASLGTEWIDGDNVYIKTENGWILRDNK